MRLPGFVIRTAALTLAAWVLPAPAQRLFTEAQWRYEFASRAIAGEPEPAFLPGAGPEFESLNKTRYQAAARYARERVDITKDTRPVAFVGILPAGQDHLLERLSMILRQLHIQAEIARRPEEADRYPILLLGAVDDLPADQWPALERYVQNGGTLVTSIRNGLADRATWDHWGDEVWRRAQPFFGFTVTGRSVGGMNGYLELEPALRHDSVARGCLVKGPFWEVLAPDATKLGKLILPWQNMGHGFAYMQAPPDVEDLSPGITLVPSGKGRVVFVTLPLFYALSSTGFTCLQDILADLIRYLAPRPPFEMDAPPGLEANLLTGQDRLLLNTVYYYANRPITTRLDIEEEVPLPNLVVRVRTGTRPSSVKLLPEGKTLPFQHEDGYTKVTVPSLAGWQVLEFAGVSTR